MSKLSINAETPSSLPQEISEDYKSGQLLAGDDLNQEELLKWYKEEEEAFFATSNTSSETDYWYIYMRYVNERLFFSTIDDDLDEGSITFFGPATGIEAEEFYKRNPGWNYNFIESSSNYREILLSKFNNSAVIEPNIDNIIDLETDSQDIVCAFACLHHIANINDLLIEIRRILKPNGAFFLREPCASMGDWRYPRSATPNERGISKRYLIDTTKEVGFECAIKPIPIVFEPINKLFLKIGILHFIPLNCLYYLDRIISKILSFNDHYWRDSFYKKLGPSSYAYVFKKK